MKWPPIFDTWYVSLIDPTTMKTPLAPLVPLIAAITLGTTMSQELQVDGKFRVKGMSMEGARVIVERNGKQVQVLQDHIAHFTLNLDLQQDYVLHFIREGCLSKSLFFDTHIPEDTRVTASFRFPFLVTLEPKPKGPVVGYAKAVGTVIFDPVRGDFDYSTYYALEREKAKRRGPSDLQKTGLGAVTETDGTSEGSAHPGVSTTVAASGSTFERGPLSRFKTGDQVGWICTSLAIGNCGGRSTHGAPTGRSHRRGGDPACIRGLDRAHYGERPFTGISESDPSVWRGALVLQWSQLQ
jgi:hypothetical protein